MSVLYIKEQGATVRKMGERIQVVKGGITLLDLPLFQVENISVIGNVQITTQALQLCMEHGIDIGYFTKSGKYLGHTCADSSRNIFLRFEQHQFYMDDEKKLAMGRTIVNYKILNQIAIIKNHRWPAASEYDWKADIEHMNKYRLLLGEKKTSGELMGIEGICSNIYFSAFGQMISGDYTFEKRTRRPPKDPVNIILSLAYTFLTRELCNALDAESFETYLGFLHGIRYGRKSLALDMVEQFRQPAVDRLVMILFGKRILGKLDFEENEDGSVSLSEDGFRKFCGEYERWMTGKNSLAGDNFRRRIHEQVSALKKCICQGETYTPYEWKGKNVSDQL